MKKNFAAFILVSLFFTLNSFAQEFIIGEVVEYVPDNKLIQVCDSLYKAELIYTDDGIKPISTTPFSSIKSRSIVQIVPLTKGEDYWTTEHVIILTGTKQKQMIEKYGLERAQGRKQSKNLVD
ncbi:MAG: hypothetical protein JRG71_03880 [Deltaproteobacteria bacterium]|nr:hypothetical protein [Deltaproteobacteria bacterium]